MLRRTSSFTLSTVNTRPSEIELIIFLSLFADKLSIMPSRILRKHLRFCRELVVALLRFVHFAWSRVPHILVLNFRWLYPSWLIYYICTFWNVPFCNIWRVFPSTILTLNIVVIVWFWRWRKVGKISSFCLDSLHLSHCLHSLLKFFALDFPFGCLFLLLFTEIWLFSFLDLLLLSYCRNIFLFSFADFLVLINSIGCKFPPALFASN